MAYYRDLASNVTGEQNEAYVSGGSQSLPSARNEVIPPNDNSLPVVHEQRQDGYDELFDPPVTSDYECSICLMCLRDPVQTACGHRFCKSCIERHIRTNGRRCPADNQELGASDVFSDNFAKREINQFTVKCRTVKNNKPCPWSGELQKVEDHLKICEFVELPCPKACGQNIERKALDNHNKKECPKRITTCAHCKTEVQYRNYKDHLERCQKVQVNCGQCNKKMLREKLLAHDKECPKAQAACEFKNYGCKWMGLRLSLPAHLQSDTAAHLSFVVAAISAGLPNNQNQTKAEKTRGASSKSEAGASSKSEAGASAATGSSLDEMNRQVAKNGETINQLKTSMEQMERKLREQNNRMERQQNDHGATVNTIKNSIVELEARMCDGVYLWRIVGYARHLENAQQGVATAVHSPPFYTSFYGYKLCLRVNPNGVDTGYGTHVSLFVHMMQSEWDDTLEWPFSGRISLSILDQSDDNEYKRHISETLITRPNLLAFQRPTTPRNHKGYGYVEFAHLETIQDRQYVKNDCLLIRVQVFH